MSQADSRIASAAAWPGFDPAKASSVDCRAAIVEALRLDLVGPDNDHAFARELLPESPRRWYLTGYLVPTRLPDREADQGEEDEIDSPAESEGADDGDAVDRRAAKKGLLPSSMGLSILVPPGVDSLSVRVDWGDYDFEPSEDGEEEEAQPTADLPDEGESDRRSGSNEPRRRGGFRRMPRTAHAAVALGLSGADRQPAELEGSAGLQLVTTVRAVTASGSRLPAGTRSVAVFLVNNRAPDPERAYTRFAFQPRLTVECAEPFVPRPDLRGGREASDDRFDDADERIADVQYRDAVDFAVGHGVSVTWSRDAAGNCRAVQTEWIPDASVDRVEPQSIAGVTLGMEDLGRLPDDPGKVREALGELVTKYRSWIDVQARVIPSLEPARRDTTEGMIAAMKNVARRIEAGIELIATDPQARDAFRIANRAMAAAARRRQWISGGREGRPETMSPPTWRPFQLAFFLLSLAGLTDELHADRERVDLLFFPTGGGKTEAYLGLAAYTMVLRRLRHGVPGGCGLAVLMRYTLRLLTLDQLGRATALMCALELERLADKGKKLGEWPFEIGLWVGMAATPNRMGKRGDDEPGKESTAYTRTMRFKKQPDRHSAPIPIEECPWCGTRFTPDSFRLEPNPAAPLDLKVTCVDHTCEFAGDRPLPIIAVDEPIYRRLPAFLIATVDKFASLPWTGRTGTLLGRVDRHDGDGFYGACDPGRGAPLPGGMLPGPDLIIQDELHLISGPLGTIAGVYESAIDFLAARQRGDRTVRPKIIASTATVRRATAQIKALFERMETQVFPPPGPDRRDSFFAITVPPETSPARLYVGVAAQGRSQKVVFLRTSLAIAAAAQRLWLAAGGKKNKQNPVDPYMTSLGYFNSLRELGGSRRIVEDEVLSRLEHYAARKRLEPADTLFASRSMQRMIPELTSRVSTGEVAATKARLQRPFTEDDRVDVALATNMISVGLDIVRLGLMLVVGQPKTSAEYIQATSRVGRDPRRPGLVVTIFNIHKPRDRSHYERFGSYHSSFYRAVEATSVTPFSPRALDRALVGTLVALVRHSDPRLTPPQGAEEVAALRPQLTAIAHRLAERARDHAWPRTPGAAQELHDLVLNRCVSLLDEWVKIIAELRATSTGLEYQRELHGRARLLYGFLDPELRDISVRRRQFRANRSMRDVEPSVNLAVRKLL